MLCCTYVLGATAVVQHAATSRFCYCCRYSKLRRSKGLCYVGSESAPCSSLSRTDRNLWMLRLSLCLAHRYDSRKHDNSKCGLCSFRSRSTVIDCYLCCALPPCHAASPWSFRRSISLFFSVPPRLRFHAATLGLRAVSRHLSHPPNTNFFFSSAPPFPFPDIGTAVYRTAPRFLFPSPARSPFRDIGIMCRSALRPCLDCDKRCFFSLCKQSFFIAGF